MKPRRFCAVAVLLAVGSSGVALAQVPGPNNAITDVPGITVGHATGTDSGATVVLATSPSGQGVGGGVTQRGGSPGTRETDLMRPDNMVETMNAVVLAGGSSYGLAAAPGVMRCLEDRGVGFSVGGANVVPIVQAAVSFDRAACGVPASRPDINSGLQACTAASGGPVAQGNVGAGTGAVSGGVKGGIGTASVVLPNGIIIGAIVSVNSEGTAYDASGNLYAASLGLGNEFGSLAMPGGQGPRPQPPALPGGPLRSGTNVVVATNVALSKSQATKIAEMADDGVARAISPAHTAGDGDTLFVLGTARLALATLGSEDAVVTQIGTAAARTVSRAIVHALRSARPTACRPSYCVAAKTADCQR